MSYRSVASVIGTGVSLEVGTAVIIEYGDPGLESSIAQINDLPRKRDYSPDMDSAVR
jgi:hypothetical protein